MSGQNPMREALERIRDSNRSWGGMGWNYNRAGQIAVAALSSTGDERREAIEEAAYKRGRAAGLTRAIQLCRIYDLTKNAIAAIERDLPRSLLHAAPDASADHGEGK